MRKLLVLLSLLVALSMVLAACGSPTAATEPEEVSRGWRRAHFRSRSRADGSGACLSGRFARCRSKSSRKSSARW